MKQFYIILISILAISCDNNKTQRKVQRIGQTTVEMRYVDKIFTIGDTIELKVLPNNQYAIATDLYIILK